MNISRSTHLTVVLMIALLLTGLPACDQVQQLFTPATPEIEAPGVEISVGFILPKTGALASDGVGMRQGTELAVEEVNHSQSSYAQIKLITEDGKSTVEGAVEAAKKLIYQEGVPVILGLGTSSQAVKVFPIAHDNQVVAFSQTSAARGLSALTEFGFRASLTVDKLVPNGVQITHQKLGYQRVAKMLDSIDVFSQSSDAVLAESIEATGVEILTTETFETGDTDFSAQLTRIKAADPDAIFISALPPEVNGILMQARQLGIPADIPFIVLLFVSEQVQMLGAVAEGVISFTNWSSTTATSQNQAFVKKYSLKYGVEPNTWAAQAYASIYILAKAITDAQSTDPIAIRDAMANITDFDTVLGKFSFNADGDAVYDPKILIVKNGELQIFE